MKHMTAALLALALAVSALTPALAQEPGSLPAADTASASASTSVSASTPASDSASASQSTSEGASGPAQEQSLPALVEAADPGAVIDLNGAAWQLDATLTVAKALTFRNGTIRAGGALTDNLINVTADGAAFENVTLDAGGTAKYAVQFYGPVAGRLENSTVQGGRFTGVLVNGAAVTLRDVAFAGNFTQGQYSAGVELAMGSAVSSLPSVTLQGAVSADAPGLVYIDTCQITPEKLAGGSYGDLVSATGNLAAFLRLDETILANLLAAAQAGETIDLAGQTVALSRSLTLDKAVTVQNGSLTAGETFPEKGDNLVTVTAPGAALRSLTLDGAGRAKYAVHFYSVADALLADSTVRGGLYNGVLLNGAAVTVRDVSFAGNGGGETDRGGIELGMGSGVSAAPQLTLAGQIDSDVPAHVVQLDTAQVTADKLAAAGTDFAGLVDDSASNLEVTVTEDGATAQEKPAQEPGEEPEQPAWPTEGLEGFVTRNYQVALGRDPDEAGFADWVRWLEEGTVTPAECAWGFVFSKEMNDKDLDDKAFVETLYRLLMDREGEATGVAFWQGYLAAGRTRAEVFHGFADSVEFGRIVTGFGL